MTRLRKRFWTVAVGLSLLAGCTESTGLTPEALEAQEAPAAAVARVIVDTGQDRCFDALKEITCPAAGQAYFGQDAQHQGAPLSYADNRDGTVTDLTTHLIWTQSPDLNGDGHIDFSDKLTYGEAVAYASGLVLAGYDDWRLPTIKELYSLMDFRGVDPSGPPEDRSAEGRPFLDTETFAFGYGDTSAGEREIDAQFATSTVYVSTTMGGNRTMFGVNFADGRIKGYPISATPMDPNGKAFYLLLVRGEEGYAEPLLTDNGDGTLTDAATGLMWSRDDSGRGMDWGEALAWVEAKNAEGYLGHDDWRLPNVKELQALVDYTRAPDVTGSAALDPLFNVTSLVNEAGEKDYPAFWSSTTHRNGSANPGGFAAYVCFGRALGYMHGQWMDVHGAGAQRSDPKAGSAQAWPLGHGPQGDAIRVDNFVRLVRDASD